MSSPRSIRVTDAQLADLLSTASVRRQSQRVLTLCEQGGTAFRFRPEKLGATTDFVLAVTKDNYPDLSKIPFHARWEHFQVGGVDRLARLDRALAGRDSTEAARAKLDLVVVSVLLDAGAGPDWSYRDADGRAYARSEGLAVASLDLFLAGAFSAEPKDPLRVDAAALRQLDADRLGRGFQVSATNPLVGLDGRAALLRRLGDAMAARPDFFGAPGARPSGLIDWYAKQIPARELSSDVILRGLLLGFQDMWPARVVVNGVGFGDVWSYDLGGVNEADNLVPFHKLSQWLGYSLFEPLQLAGFTLTGAERLTGLPEYRNGGLFLDEGVLELRDPADLERTHRPADKLIIEWRALTVAILDRLGAEARRKLGLSETELPLGKILQGGTWAAGRRTAAKLRGGNPPLRIDSDGTVF